MDLGSPNLCGSRVTVYAFYLSNLLLEDSQPSVVGTSDIEQRASPHMCLWCHGIWHTEITWPALKEWMNVACTGCPINLSLVVNTASLVCGSGRPGCSLVFPRGHGTLRCNNILPFTIAEYSSSWQGQPISACLTATAQVPINHLFSTSVRLVDHLREETKHATRLLWQLDSNML